MDVDKLGTIVHGCCIRLYTVDVKRDFSRLTQFGFPTLLALRILRYSNDFLFVENI
jgi:hypothetical protein